MLLWRKFACNTAVKGKGGPNVTDAHMKKDGETFGFQFLNNHTFHFTQPKGCKGIYTELSFKEKQLHLCP